MLKVGDTVRVISQFPSFLPCSAGIVEKLGLAYNDSPYATVRFGDGVENLYLAELEVFNVDVNETV